MDYDPAICDLCKSMEYRIVIDIQNVSVTSDCRILESGLRKIECLKCKLVRNGYPFSKDEFNLHYGTMYTLGQRAALAEPLFFTESEPIPRSKIIFDWMLKSLSEIRFSDPSSIVEIGCGEGSLLSHFTNYWKNCSTYGIEMNKSSVLKARKKGLQVRQGSYRNVTGNHDLILSFAVIEHVPSPGDFMTTLKSHLKPDGLLLVAQPCQDYGSNDLFFSDHLYHFYSEHITEIGIRAGLNEIKKSINNKYMPNFSLHIFQNGFNKPDLYSAEVKELRTSIEQTISRWKGIFHSVNDWLKQNKERKLAIWGVGETFTLLFAYTDLKDYPIHVAFDDNLERYTQSGFPFPVIRFESRSSNEDAELAVLLTFKPGSKVINRLKESSILYYAPIDTKVV